MQVITKGMRKELRFHWKRTGVPSSGIIKTASSLPDGVTVALLNGWINGTIDRAKPEQWEFVIGLWSALPDCDAHLKRISSRQKGAGRPRDPDTASRIPLTREMSEQFKSELARTNADMERDILNVAGAPDGVTQRLLYIWKYQHAKTTRSDHWNFVMDRLRAMPDFESKFSKA